MIWELVDDRWAVTKLFKGVDWSSVDWYAGGKQQCPVCAENGDDTTGDNLKVYDLDDEDRPTGAKCYGLCGTVVVSVEKALEDEQERSSTNGKLLKESSSKKVEKNAKPTEVKGSVKVSVTSRDYSKLEESRLRQDEIDKIFEETDGELKVKYRGLDPKICQEFGIRWKYDDGRVSEMWSPYYIREKGKLSLTGYKVRKVSKFKKQKDKHFTEGYVGKLSCMFGEVLNVTEKVIYVGGEIDVISATQMLRKGLAKYPSRKFTVVSSPLGEVNTRDSIAQNYEWLMKHNSHILALDNDEAGMKGQELAKEILPLSQTLEANLSIPEGDANDYLSIHNDKTYEDYTRDVYWNPTPCKTFGVMGSKELLKGIRERLSQDKIPFPRFLSDLAQGFTDGALWLGEWVNWISSVSSGKSTVFDAWMIDWALSSPYRQAILSYEADYKSFGVKVASLATARAVMRIEGKENRLRWVDENEDKILELLQDESGNDRFEFVDKLPSSVEDAKELLLFLVKVKNVKVIWIDPMLDFLSLCQGNKAHYDDLIMFLDRLRMTEDVTIMSSLHTRKNLSSGANGSNGGEINEEDAYGGREVIAKATVNITAQRNKSAEDWIERNTMVINIRKSRNDGATGNESKLFYRAKANRLYPFTYAEQMNFFKDDFDKRVEDIDVDDDFGFQLGQGMTIDSIPDVSEDVEAAYRSEEEEVDKTDEIEVESEQDEEESEEGEEDIQDREVLEDDELPF